MAGFRYEALDDAGRVQRGVLEVDSPRQARKMLRAVLAGTAISVVGEAENGSEAARTLQQLAKSLRGKWDYFFVHVDPRLWKGLVPPEGSAPGLRPILEGEVMWKLVSLSRDPIDAERRRLYGRSTALRAVVEANLLA